MANPKHNPDCLHYDGIRECPLSPSCLDCTNVSVARTHAIIILLGRPGDVLIASGLIGPLHKQFPNLRLTWLTADESFSLLDGNPQISRLLTPSSDAFSGLDCEFFDVLINLDRSHIACSWATRIPAQSKSGFGLSRHGQIVPLSPSSEILFDINRLPGFRGAEKRSWIEIYHNVAGISFDAKDCSPPLLITAEELIEASNLRERVLRSGRTRVVCICPGSHKKDLQKRVTPQFFSELVSWLSQDEDLAICVLAGPHEEELYQSLLSESGTYFADLGIQRTFRNSIVTIYSSDIVISTDTLSLHIALALRKPTVALFGPTSPSLILADSKVITLRAREDCAPCYKRTCIWTGVQVGPPCLTEISVPNIGAAVQRFKENPSVYAKPHNP